MRAEFTVDLAPGSFGRLSFRHRNQPIEMNVRVAHANSAQSGLEFLGDQDRSRAMISDMVDSLSVMRDHRVIMLAPRPIAPHGQSRR